MTTANIGIGNFSATGARFQVESTRLTTSVANNFNPSFVESQNVLTGECILSNCVYSPSIRSDLTQPTSRYVYLQEGSSPIDPTFRLLLKDCTVANGPFGDVLRHLIQVNINSSIISGNRTINIVDSVAKVYRAPLSITRSLRLDLFLSNEIVFVNNSFTFDNASFTPTLFQPCIAFDN
jgi:hypothetical protein